jgi:hypothetical protein
LAPEITASLFANYRSSVDALLELVDNSVDSRVGSQQLRVDLILRADWLQITTVGGQGMAPRDVEGHYLRWGGSPKRGRNLLGQYGQGGKAAIGHLGRRFTIEASRAGDPACWQFSDPDYRDRSRLKVYELTPVPKRVEAALGYVRIRIDGVDRKVDTKRVGQRLAETYRPLLESEALALTLNGSPLRPPALPVAERTPFRVNAASGRLTGWFGVLAEDGPAADPGICCFRLGRLVGGGEFFGHPTPVQNPGLARLVGEVDVPNVRLTMNKSDFDRDSEPWLEVEARMHRLLGPLVRRLSRDDEAPPPASALKVAEQVRKLLGQALRLAERPDLFPGAEVAPPAKPKELDGQEELPMEEPPAEQAERAPRSPSPPAPAGHPRRSGFGRIVLRPLERSRRSQTVVEDGTRLIVINTRHPLFIERKGDTWYQLETAAREVFSLQEGASVGEYERQVNEVVMLALDLRSRRRRRQRAATAQLKLV